jgi:hypothetical protein
MPASLHPSSVTMMKLRKITHYPRLFLLAFYLEGAETTRMVRTFLREGRGRLIVSSRSKNPTAEEMQEAIEQLKDLPRFLPFFVIIIMPLPGVTEGYALVAVTLEKWLGHKVRVLPSQFRRIIQEEQQKDRN